MTPALLTLALVSAPQPVCEFAAINDVWKLQAQLSQRAVEIIREAAQPGPDAERKLKILVPAKAEFGLGGGDVGRPLGNGPKAAQALARLMNADSYRFMGQAGPGMPADGCAAAEVEIEFLNTREQWSSKVRFRFEAGKLVSARGWQQGYSAGTLPIPPQ